MGNTVDVFDTHAIIRDHPHIHGEHLNLNLEFLALSGSPPHTWGTPAISTVVFGGDRITPTYMGNTSGEDFNDIVHNGSPPHTWGTPIYKQQVRRTT